MEKEEILQKAKELREKINLWNYEYFDLDSPSVSDAVFDAHFLELKELEEKFASYFSLEELSNSPTQRVGNLQTQKFAKFRHSQQMLSLNKAYNQEDLIKFKNHINKKTDNAKVSFYIEPKIDGVSLSLIYSKGRLVQALTRGDGEIGEDVTHNAFVIEQIPKKIDFLGNLEVRGEIYVSKTNFEKIAKEIVINNKKQPANPRNLASGSLRQLNPEIAKQRCLEGLFFNIINPLDLGIKTYHESIRFLQKLGFVTPKGLLIKNFNELEEVLQEIENSREKVPYQIDGAVIKLNEFDYYQQVGETSSFPHHSIAFKYKEYSVETIVEDIFPTIGRTGIVTYNAKLLPVRLSGTIVSAATLHNWNYVKEIGLNVGDLVEVKKAGEIIPKVMRVVEKRSEGIFPKTTHCPDCKTLLQTKELLVDQFCPNSLCTTKIVRSLVHFCSKDCMDIRTLADKKIELFFAKGWIKNFSDIYKLKIYKDELIELEGQGPRSVEVLLDSIEESKQKPLWRLINALGIENIGKRNAKFLAKKIQSFSNFLDFDFNSLLMYKDIGPKTVEALNDFCRDSQNRFDIENLLELGLDLIDQEDFVQFTNLNSPWSGKKFVITGTHSIPRSQLQSLIEKAGGIVVNSVSKNIDFLVVGENPGSKLARAKTLNIMIINSDIFLEN